jgi:DNA-binding transcriptional regulator YdaS (Cro superfamily)
MESLQERMSLFMHETGLKIGEIAKIAGVSSSAVSQWTGQGGVKIKTIGNVGAAIRLERMTGFSALWLAEGNGPKKIQIRDVESPLRSSAHPVKIRGTACLSNDGRGDSCSKNIDTNGLRIKGDSAYPAIMDEMTLHRKRRLRDLIDKHPFNGNQRSFGSRMGLSDARISQMIDDRFAFGERAARSIAIKLGLDSRYFESEFRSDSSESFTEKNESISRQFLNEQAIRILVDTLRRQEPAMRSNLLPLMSILIQAPDSDEARSRVLAVLDQ